MTTYLKGFIVKPFTVLQSGKVIFTDGTNQFAPNQEQCEAYGYKYDTSTGSCVAYIHSTLLQKNINNDSNKIQGRKNTVETGVINGMINGNNQTIKRQANNNFINGIGNIVNAEVNNNIILGTNALSNISNSLVIGGNNASDGAIRQNMTFMYGCDTTDGSTVDSFVNNTTDSFFVPENNTICYFQSETLAIRVGGAASGSLGDFKAWVERGVVLNDNGTLSIDRSRTSPASSGTTTGWSPINAVSGTNFRQTVKGAASMDIKWSSTIRIMQMRFPNIS